MMEISETHKKRQLTDNDGLLTRFFYLAHNNPRIGFSHIALFTAMVQMSQGDFTVSFYAKELRQFCKIGSSRTYFKLLKDLYECGYIKYIRGPNRWQKSSVLFII
jgi:hypothetical protein